MAYTKTVWVDNSPPAISADNLNKIENGIYTNDQRIDAIVDYVTERGTSGGWTYEKYNSGKIVAEKDISTGSEWTAIGSAGFAYNSTTISPPSGMTVKSGYANLKSISSYITSAQVQIGTNVALEVHRLATSSASFNFHITLIGTYS